MNWMGGARNRVKFQGEKRIQQEFFERQKLATAQSFSSKLSSKKRKGLSQDLVALHTVSRVHSGNPNVAKKRRPIQKLDLEKFQSCTRQIDEVDMGPCSPSETPSKLQFNDGKLDRDSGSMKLTAVDVGSSRELFPKPYLKYYNSKNNSTEKDTQSWMKSSSTPMFCVENKIKASEISRKVPNTYTTSKPSNESILSKPKQDAFTSSSMVKGMFDPYVSEDFQVTPLVKYTKKRSPLSTCNEFDKCKKRRHSGETSAKDKILNEIGNKKHVNYKPSYFSSTPITYTNSAKSDKIIANKQFGGISPIHNGEIFSKDVDYGFKFKPRPMIMTPVKKNTEKPGVPQFSTQEKDVKEPLMLDISCNSSIQSRKRPGTSQSYTNKECDEYEYNFGEVSKHPHKNLNDSEESRKDMNQNDSTPFVSGCLSRGHLQGSQKISGSLGKYRNIFRHKNEQESPLLLKNSIPLKEQDDVKDWMEEDVTIEASMSKPKFADIEDEFHYKPMNPMKNGSMKLGSGIMNMYAKCGNDKGREDSDNLQDGSLESTRISGTRKNLEGSVPLPGDEFPKHLLSPSEQLQEEIDRHLKKIVADENSEGFSSSQDTGLGLYKPLKTQMDDVLCEIKQLEEQDSVASEAILDEDKKFSSEENKEDLCTESFEADAFSESDDILLETIKEHTKVAEKVVHKKTTSDETSGSDVVDITVKNDQVKDEIEVTDQNNMQPDRQSAAGAQEEAVDNAEKDSDVFPNKYEVEKCSDGDCVLQTSSKSLYKDVKSHSQEFDTEVLKEFGGKVFKDSSENVEADMERSICSNVCGKKDGSIIEEITASEISFDTSDTVQDVFRSSKENDKNLIVSNRAANDLIVLNQLQVQEISSGKNQSTQTDVESQVYKSFAEVSTSPFKELETLKFVSDIGVQCDLPLFPSLSNLAGKCYKVKPVNKSLPA